MDFERLEICGELVNFGKIPLHGPILHFIFTKRLAYYELGVAADMDPLSTKFAG